MRSLYLGNELQRNALLGHPQQCQTSFPTRPVRRQVAVVTRSIADIVKEKPSTGSNGVGRIQLKDDERSLETDIVRKANYVVGSEELEPFSAYRATALSVREHLIEAFNNTQRYWK